MSPTMLLGLKHAILLLMCVAGDKLLQVVQKPPMLKAAIDNMTHALIGLLVTEIVVRNFKDHLGRHEMYLLVGFGFTLSSWIDFDHFIEARSFHLEDATSLDRRPFLHNSTIFLLLLIAITVVVRVQESWSLSLWTAVTFIAFFTHQLRDAIRRGLWFRAPYVNFSTAPVIYWVYLALIQLSPHAVIQLLGMQYQHTRSLPVAPGDYAVKYKPLEVV